MTEICQIPTDRNRTWFQSV